MFNIALYFGLMNFKIFLNQRQIICFKKILEEQRRLKREQEEADIASRRHAGVVLTHQQFITNERFGDLLTISDSEKRKSGPEVTDHCHH